MAPLNFSAYRQGHVRYQIIRASEINWARAVVANPDAYGVVNYTVAQHILSLTGEIRTNNERQYPSPTL
jgi:hypothetical protein